MIKKILIAEDEKALATALDLKLKTEGFETTLVFDGQQAIDAIKNGGYSLVLLDLILPKIDGFVALKQMRDLDKELKIVVLSNLGQQEDIARARGLGMNAFYIKSNTPIVEIVQKVKDLTK